MTKHPLYDAGVKVMAKIRAAQKSALQREIASHACPCASGTWESDGAKILAHMRKKNLAAFQAAANADRKRRTDAQIIAAYETAMADKRQRESAPLAIAA